MASRASKTTVVLPDHDLKYPDCDGKPVGETGIHVDALFNALGVLRRFHARNSQITILANMFLYYERGNPRRNVCPDLFVTLGVPSNTTRRTFKVWQEGKGPDLVIEFTSKATRDEDLDEKFKLYRDVLHVREYFLFDPLGEYLEPSLQGFRLVEGRYEPIEWVSGKLPSVVLNLHLEQDGLDLRFFNPVTGRLLPTMEELDQAVEATEAALREEEASRRKEEAARRREETARRKAEAEVERLRREIEALRRRLSEERE